MHVQAVYSRPYFLIGPGYEATASGWRSSKKWVWSCKKFSTSSTQITFAPPCQNPGSTTILLLLVLLLSGVYLKINYGEKSLIPNEPFCRESKLKVDITLYSEKSDDSYASYCSLLELVLLVKFVARLISSWILFGA